MLNWIEEGEIILNGKGQLQMKFVLDQQKQKYRPEIQVSFLQA